MQVCERNNIVLQSIEPTWYKVTVIRLHRRGKPQNIGLYLFCIVNNGHKMTTTTITIMTTKHEISHVAKTLSRKFGFRET